MSNKKIEKRIEDILNEIKEAGFVTDEQEDELLTKGKDSDELEAFLEENDITRDEFSDEEISDELEDDFDEEDDFVSYKNILVAKNEFIHARKDLLFSEFGFVLDEESGNKKNILSSKQERMFLKRIKNEEKNSSNYEELTRLFAYLNTGLVVRLSSYYHHHSFKMVFFDSCIQSGMRGLLEAIDKYDLEKKNRFSTYAVPYIKARILDNLKEHGINPISGEMYETIKEVQEFIKGRELEKEEVINELASDYENKDIPNLAYSICEVQAFIEEFIKENGKEPEKEEVLDELAFDYKNKDIPNLAYSIFEWKDCPLDDTKQYKRLEYAIKEVKKQLDRCKNKGLEPDRETIVKHLQKRYKRYLSDAFDNIKNPTKKESLDSLIDKDDDDRDTTLGDLVPDPGPSVEEIVENKNRCYIDNKILKFFDGLEREIIRRRFGANDGTNSTPADIANDMGISLDKVCEICGTYNALIELQSKNLIAI